MVLFVFSLRKQCFCGNEINENSITSESCQLPCTQTENPFTIDCCGGPKAFSVFDIRYFRQCNTRI